MDTLAQGIDFCIVRNPHFLTRPDSTASRSVWNLCGSFFLFLFFFSQVSAWWFWNPHWRCPLCSHRRHPLCRVHTAGQGQRVACFWEQLPVYKTATLDFWESSHSLGKWEIMDLLGFNFNHSFQGYAANLRGDFACTSLKAFVLPLAWVILSGIILSLLK